MDARALRVAAAAGDLEEIKKLTSNGKIILDEAGPDSGKTAIAKQSSVQIKPNGEVVFNKSYDALFAKMSESDFSASGKIRVKAAIVHEIKKT